VESKEIPQGMHHTLLRPLPRLPRIIPREREGAQEVGMSSEPVQRPDAPESKSDASASGPGTKPVSARLSPEQHDRIAKRAYELAAQRDFRAGHEVDDWLQAEREIEAGPARNTPPDNPFDEVRTSSNEDR
jgi:hypothetical protein